MPGVRGIHALRCQLAVSDTDKLVAAAAQNLVAVAAQARDAKRADAAFLTHYHKRSKMEVAARNEVPCKVLCHNICCLISATHELGIEPMFGLAK